MVVTAITTKPVHHIEYGRVKKVQKEIRLIEQKQGYKPVSKRSDPTPNSTGVKC